MERNAAVPVLEFGSLVNFDLGSVSIKVLAVSPSLAKVPEICNEETRERQFDID
ncbi:MAG: hypothetical protein ABIS49_11905 [Aestuariivirga sp.]